MERLLVPSAALLWGLQFALLSPALALLLVALFNATPALSALLGVGTSLPLAVVGLIVLGGPAGVGSSLLFAHLKHSGAGPADVVNTRAIVSFAWVAGPPLATCIMGGLGNRAILPALGAVAVLNVATTAAMIARRRADPVEDRPKAHGDDDGQVFSKTGVAAVVVGFIALQATNSAAVSIMSLFVTQGLSTDVIWAGIALGVSALGYQGVFAACAALTVLALTIIASTRRPPRRESPNERLAATAPAGTIPGVGS
jgi:MFS transporter, SET family, sugar efflux transporter